MTKTMANGDPDKSLILTRRVSHAIRRRNRGYVSVSSVATTEFPTWIPSIRPIIRIWISRIGDREMSDNEDVSIILTNYNHAAYLPRSIEAVLNQTAQPRELLIIDDASTDDSMEIIERYSRQDSLIRVHRNEQNQGVIESLNRHLNKARGDYLITAGGRLPRPEHDRTFRVPAAAPSAGGHLHRLVFDVQGKGRGIHS